MHFLTFSHSLLRIPLRVSPTMSKHARSASMDNGLKHPSTKRAKEIDNDTPFDELKELLSKNKSDSKPRNVLHWFRSKDLRSQDNRALHAASTKAKEGGGSLITLYLHSPKDLAWHGTSPARIDLMLETLQMLKAELEKKNIPLAVLTAENRKEKSDKVQHFVEKHDVSHVYANMEYEVDELRRDIDLATKFQDGKEEVSFEVLHDQTVVVPGELKTGAGGPHKVFTPYHKAWLVETKKNPELLDLVSPPEENDTKAKDEFIELFETKIPGVPEGKEFASKEEKERIRKLWPAGHDAGIKRLQDFLQIKVSQISLSALCKTTRLISIKIQDYAAHRSEPALDPSSRLSAYISAGIISIREILAACTKHNENAHFDAGDANIAAWVRELVFREFYRHITAMIPHGSMNLPQNMKFDNVRWEEDEEGWKKWYEGKTGVPFVDAGMRQLANEAYMHNRLRMNVSSYLSANLLIDYRRGERWFAEHLVDWDLSNNTQGWEPSYTIFNPVSQAEKCDKDGDYIRKWVPELKDVQGKAIFAPHERLSKGEFEKLGYPKPHVDYKETSQRAKERYKKDLAEAPNP